MIKFGLLENDILLIQDAVLPTLPTQVNHEHIVINLASVSSSTHPDFSPYSMTSRFDHVCACLVIIWLSILPIAFSL